LQLLRLYTFGTSSNKPNVASPSQYDTFTNPQNNQEPETKIEILEDLKTGSTNNNGATQNDSTEKKNSINRNNVLMFVFCFLGLQVSFLLWGLIQERIVKFGYEDNQQSNEKELIAGKTQQLANFSNSQILVLTNRIAGTLLSLFIMMVFNKKEIVCFGKCVLMNIRQSKSLSEIVSYKNWPPLYICSYSALSNVLSSWFQYESLKYVSFTSQLLAKSSKSVFVMLTGKVVSNKNYKLYEYVTVFLISVGIFLFSEINRPENGNEMISTSLPGIICIICYLITDSFTSTWQEDLIKEHAISSISLMFITNFYSVVYTLVSSFSQNELQETWAFLNEHSEITYHILLLSITSSIGQIFIFLTIQNFGALVFSLIMTTRQVLSILLSTLIFGHYISFQGVLGLVIIFSALFMQQYCKFRLK
jgi:adenosine 3'-phospho 5'-phosphosulfate transporter B2